MKIKAKTNYCFALQKSCPNTPNRDNILLHIVDVGKLSDATFNQETVN